MNCLVQVVSAPAPQVIVDEDRITVEVPSADPVVIEVGVPGLPGPPGALAPVAEVSGEAVDVGDAVYLDADGRVRRASSVFASGAWRAYGIAASATLGAGEVINVWTLHGAPVPAARVDSPPLASDNGRHLFTTTTPGVLSLTPPTGQGQVRFVVAILQGADGSTSTPAVRLFPQFISRTP